MSGKAWGVQANWRQVCVIMNLLGGKKPTKVRKEECGKVLLITTIHSNIILHLPSP